MGDSLAIDATDLAAFANGQRYVSKNGPERKRFSDPDASWGHRSAVSTRKGGGFYGYKLHMAVCTKTGLPLAWRVESARHHESLYVEEVMASVIQRGFTPRICALDKGYDYTRVYEALAEHGCDPVIPLSRPLGVKTKDQRRVVSQAARRHPKIARDTETFRAIYHTRGAVEREFGRLKHDYALAPLRVRGVARVALHADLTMLSRLGLALHRLRQNPKRLAA